ncbi:hypothetical protein [Paludibaculum fermentans]|uniref:Uncharacterized protein n=1 Tax=Paludibaculum fermentans TaxID=1473598 RepID=A0A7S7SP02_PALFE|nr:hypothetical protein [Paludibaculum fermentans]QOY91478.1 hypothetical protein IRI77_16470 [Paludibaculum fermentans]
MKWLRGLVQREKSSAPAPLRGVPAIRRQKNYLAMSGYAYEYFYEGLRDLPGRREHVFTVSGDRKTWFEVQVRVPGASVSAWEAGHGRGLADNERYAIAKMALFEAFDTRETPVEMNAPVEVSAEQVEELLGRLGFE